MIQAPIAEVEAPPAKGGEAVSLHGGLEEDMAAFYRENYGLRRLASALEYVTEGGLRAYFHSRLQGIERRITHLRSQLSQHYTGEPLSSGAVKVCLKPGSPIPGKVISLLQEKDEIESRLSHAESLYNETAGYISRAIVGKLAKTMPRSERAEESYRAFSRRRVTDAQEGLQVCVEAIRGVASDGRWVYFPVDQPQRHDPYFLQLARVSSETGRSILEIATMFHGNSQDVELVRVTPDGRERVDLKEFKGGAEAVRYFVSLTELNKTT